MVLVCVYHDNKITTYVIFVRIVNGMTRSRGRQQQQRRQIRYDDQHDDDCGGAGGRCDDYDALKMSMRR